MRTRRGDAEVERTKPGSSLDFRLEYENSKKWTDDDPRDGIGEEGELEDIFDELDVKRMVKKLEKAVKSYLNGDKGAQNELRARGKEMDRVLGEDRALTVVRHLKGSVDNKKVKEALEIAKDVIGGKKAMTRIDRIAMKIARVIVGKAREGDYYVVRKDSGFVDVKGQEHTLKKGEIWEVSKTGKVIRLLVLRDRRKYYVDVAEEVLGGIIRNRIFKKVDRDEMPSDPNSWTDEMFVDFGKKNILSLKKALLGEVAAAARKILVMPSSVNATLDNGKYYFRKSYSANTYVGSSTSIDYKDVKWPRDFEEVLDSARSRGNLYLIVKPAMDDIQVSKITKTTTSTVNVEGEQIKAPFVGKIRIQSKDERGAILKSMFALVNPGALTKEVERIDAQESSVAQQEIVEAVRGKLEEAVNDYLVGLGEIDVDTRWTWDPGQKGGWDDPSWDPYVDEVIYDVDVEVDVPYFIVLDAAKITDEQLDKATWDEGEAIRKSLKGMGRWQLEEIPFSFDIAGVQESSAMVNSMTLNGDISLVLSPEPDDEALAEVLTERDGRDE